jgi:hypothetical protein
MKLISAGNESEERLGRNQENISEKTYESPTSCGGSKSVIGKNYGKKRKSPRVI